jgi:hypothetical protein
MRRHVARERDVPGPRVGAPTNVLTRFVPWFGPTRSHWVAASNCCCLHSGRVHYFSPENSSNCERKSVVVRSISFAVTVSI